MRHGPLKVAFVSPHDPASPLAWSGTLYSMFGALAGRGLAVERVGDNAAHLGTPWDRLRLGLASILCRGTLRRLIFRARARHHLVTGPAEAARIDAELATGSWDLVFAPVASTLVAFLETKLPVVYASDATARLLESTYRSHWPRPLVDDLDACEARSLDRADLVLYSSDWAAASASHHYGVEAERLRVIPFGPNIEPVPPLSSVEAERVRDACRLLFLSSDWRRKGGPAAAAVTAALRRQGIDARLVVCGHAPSTVLRASHVRRLPFLRKTMPAEREQLVRLLSRSHFMLALSHADCTPVALCEAKAFALPVATTETGGIPSLVRDGEGGFLFPPDADARDVAAALARVWSEPARYQALARAARRSYEEEFNWGRWSERVAAEMEALAGARRDAGPAAVRRGKGGDPRGPGA